MPVSTELTAYWLSSFLAYYNMPELMAFIARWKTNATDVSKAEVEEARNIWFSGGGY